MRFSTIFSSKYLKFSGEELGRSKSFSSQNSSKFPYLDIAKYFFPTFLLLKFFLRNATVF